MHVMLGVLLVFADARFKVHIVLLMGEVYSPVYMEYSLYSGQGCFLCVKCGVCLSQFVSMYVKP